MRLSPPQEGSDHQGEQWEGGEDQGSPGGRYVEQGEVQQRDQHAELQDAKQGDGQQVGDGKAPSGRHGQGREQAEDTDQVAQEGQGAGPGLVDHEASRDNGRADLDAGAQRGGHPQVIGAHSSRSQVSPTRSLPKL